MNVQFVFQELPVITTVSVVSRLKLQDEVVEVMKRSIPDHSNPVKLGAKVDIFCAVHILFMLSSGLS